MWKFLLFVGALIIWPELSGQQYLTTIDNVDFYVPLVPILPILPLTNANIKRTCTSYGLSYPCHTSGCDGCTDWWEPGCIMYDSGGISCYTHEVLSAKLCGTTDPGNCWALDNTFVVNPGWQSDDSAWGVSPNLGVGLPGTAIQNCTFGMKVLCARAPPPVCRNSASSCQNGASYYNYTCQCAPGYTGALCETDIDECANSPCLGGGTCVDHVNGYSCVCPEGFVGDKCETVAYAASCLLFSSDAVSYYEASQECQIRGGHLVDVKEAELQRLIASAGSDVSPWIGLKLSPGVITYTDGSSISDELQWLASDPIAPCDLCVYLDGTNGHLAKTASSCMEQHHYVCQSDPKPCERNICYNNGVCSTCFNDSYSVCSCSAGYEGNLCNINIDECASNPCQNGGTCLHDVDSYHCHCDIGYGGVNCQNDLDLCAQVACPFNWQCQDEGNHFICLAGTNRMTGPYSCSIASCPDGMYCKEEGPASFSCRAG